MPDKNGIIIVDHGSRIAESNTLLERVSTLFAVKFAADFAVVEPAHMELAEPSIATAYARCAKRGAGRIVVCPFFLGPGKHWTHDIPELTQKAAAGFPETSFCVAAPLGVDDLMLDLLYKRSHECLRSQ
jgi:sirohydrochlorin ferrochelatase